jgi:hypothetical protein
LLGCSDVNVINTQLTLGRFAVELESEQAKKEAKAMEQQQAKKVMEEPMRRK